MAQALRQLHDDTGYATIAAMNIQILPLFISCVALILSGYALYRVGKKPSDASAPTVGTKGAGGGGW